MECYCEDVNKSVMDLSENNVVSDKLREKWIEYGELKWAMTCIPNYANARVPWTSGSSGIDLFTHIYPEEGRPGYGENSSMQNARACTRMVERCNDGNFCIVGDTGIPSWTSTKRTKTGKFVEEPSALLEIVKDSLSATSRLPTMWIE
jgi:hypothetical protein